MLLNSKFFFFLFFFVGEYINITVPFKKRNTHTHGQNQQKEVN